ncbi:RNA polymerase sigma factor SigW [Exiguobacterium flavidum]|uniref:RNA polymerase sigma factor SigW n=1 Tax=Exiguobacterium flavidum TaxID=2184695 RepID=UPI000DF80A65|nr:RNA polymerase sigma factor SigW [Exiguobacterium flavidum]
MEETTLRLIERVKGGDRDAFAALVDLYKDGAFLVAFRVLRDRMEAEDATQEAFIRVYTKIDTYNAQWKFRTWLYRIVTNVSIDRLRKKQPDYSLDAEMSGTEGLTLYSQLESKDKLPEQQAVESEQRSEVEQAIAMLPEKYRVPLVLKYVEDLSLKEISEMTDLPVATVKTRIHRGREALKKQFVKR